MIKTVSFFILCVLLASTASAKIPYSELDILRKQNIVTQVAAEAAQQPWVKKCLDGNKVALVKKGFSSQMDKTANAWQKLEIKAADVPDLKRKIEACEARASCQVYDHFLNSTQASKKLTDEILEMKSLLEKKMTSLDAKAYQKAFAEINQPCLILQGLASQ